MKNVTIRKLAKEEEDPKYTYSVANYAHTSGYFIQPASGDDSMRNTETDDDSLLLPESKIKPK